MTQAPVIATPPQPPTPEYVDARDALVASALRDRALLESFRRANPLPPGYGVALDERVVEYPWALSHAPLGRLLDAGSVLNFPHVLDAFQPQVDELYIATLEPEERSYPERRISYVYCDIRELPFRSRAFDTAICISTLEHVGMDNRGYGSAAGREADPRRQAWTAMAELRRVLKPGGVALVTVPYGRREDHGWLRQLDGAEVDELIAAFEPRHADVCVYRYDRDGWQVSDRDAARASQYRDVTRDPAPAGDHAAAARAVACLRLTT